MDQNRMLSSCSHTNPLLDSIQFYSIQFIRLATLIQGASATEQNESKLLTKHEYIIRYNKNYNGEQIINEKTSTFLISESKS